MQRVFFIILLFAINAGPVTSYAQQKTTTKMKAGLEAGHINTGFAGKGILIRSFFKINIQKKFPKSLLKINTRLVPEIFNTSELITGYRLFLQLEYLLPLSTSNSLYLNLSGKNQVHFLDKTQEQVFNEIDGKILFSQKLSKILSLDIQESLLARIINASQPGAFSKNNVQSDLTFNSSKYSTFKIGGFWEYLHFSYSGNIDAYNNRQGPLFEYSYTKNLIFKTQYKLGIDIKNKINTQWINFIGGKYISKKISVFVFLYYLWQEKDRQNEEEMILTQLESFNNFTLKIGYDLSESANLYFKIVYESQEIFRDGQNLSFWQTLIGFQKTF